MQIMSAITGCEAGARATGLIDPNRRADAYTDCTKLMRKYVPALPDGARSDIKQAVMTSLYGSKREPKNIFGEGTHELNAFYKAMFELAPGACELLDDLLNSWQPFALTHQWKLPDGFDARVKVMEKVEKRLEVDELDHATFTYEYYENQGREKGLSNVANVIHSVDAYVLRCLVRRCNYARDTVEDCARAIEAELLERAMGEAYRIPADPASKVAYYEEQYDRSGMADAVILPHLNEGTITHLSSRHLKALSQIVNRMLEHKPFPVVSVHDEFKCHANNMNHLRQHYIDIFAELAESRILDDLLSQVYGQPGTFPKKSANLATKIRNCNYALS